MHIAKEVVALVSLCVRNLHKYHCLMFQLDWGTADYVEVGDKTIFFFCKIKIENRKIESRYLPTVRDLTNFS